MRLNRVFSDLESFEYDDGELDLDCAIVTLRGSKSILSEIGAVVRCPMCGIVMVYIGNYEVMCPECGIIG